MTAPTTTELESQIGINAPYFASLLAAVHQMDERQAQAFSDKYWPLVDQPYQGTSHPFLKPELGMHAMRHAETAVRNSPAAAWLREHCDLILFHDEVRDGDDDFVWAFIRTAEAVATRNLIPREHYDQVTIAWRRVIGPVHPDDPEWGMTQVEQLLFWKLHDENAVKADRRMRQAVRSILD